MTAELVPFTYAATKTVRVVTIDGEPWFVLADLCRVLRLANVKDVRDRLADGVDQTYPIADSLGRTQQATIVSEAGMYEVSLPRALMSCTSELGGSGQLPLMAEVS